MHPSENEQNHAELGAFQLDRFAERADWGLGLEGQGDIANVDEIEAGRRADGLRNRQDPHYR